MSRFSIGLEPELWWERVPSSLLRAYVGARLIVVNMMKVCYLLKHKDRICVGSPSDPPAFAEAYRDMCRAQTETKCLLMNVHGELIATTHHVATIPGAFALSREKDMHTSIELDSISSKLAGNWSEPSYHALSVHLAVRLRRGIDYEIRDKLMADRRQSNSNCRIDTISRKQLDWTTEDGLQEIKSFYPYLVGRVFRSSTPSMSTFNILAVSVYQEFARAWENRLKSQCHISEDEMPVSSNWMVDEYIAKSIADLQQWKEVLRASDVPVPFQGRPACLRDHLWLKWYNEEELRPAAIRDRWDAMSDSERQAECPSAWQKVGEVGKEAGRDIVKKALKKAQGESYL